jgi:4-diphosphocytidyl-2-C-methyl-D-erythritol kinase
MIRELAPAKVNLVLQVGGVGPSGLHQLCSLFASLELADELEIEPRPDGRDEVVCPGVAEPNLARTAALAFRHEVKDRLPGLRIRIDKRIPVAAGLGGGSADAAAVLRAASTISGEPLDAEDLGRLAEDIGSDVPSQLNPAHAVVTGTGEHVEPVDLPDAAVVLVPQEEGLSTAEVYAEADRIGSTRDRLDPRAVHELARKPLAELAAGLENDLQPAALSLRPELAATIDRLRAAGALGAQVAGSGPTIYGLFEDAARAREAAALWSDAIVTRLRSI